MKILLDVGAHYGESLDVALDPRWGFQRIVCFEPSSECAALIRGFRDPRIEVVEAGLSAESRTAELFGSGLLGGSVYADKVQPSAGGENESIQLVRASTWLIENTRPDDTIFLKLNCEGSECDVLDDIFQSDIDRHIESVYVDFDVRKVPSQAHREVATRELLITKQVRFWTPEDLGESAERAIAPWLDQSCERTENPSGRLRYRLRLYRPPYIWARGLSRTVLPQALFTRAASRWGLQGSKIER